MNFKDFLSRVKSDSLYKNIIIYGEELYHIDDAIKSIISKYTDENFRTFNVSKIPDINSEENFCRLINDISTVPLMSSKKIVIIENSDFLSSKSSFKFDDKKMMEIINRTNDDVYLLFILKNNKVDARKKIVKEMKKNNSVFYFDRLNKYELIKYINRIFMLKKISINNVDIEYFAENSGYLDYETDKTLFDINNELKKLVLYAMSEKKIDRHDIDEVMHKSLNTNIFNLVDAICIGNKKQAYVLLEDMLLSGASEQYIIYMIYRQYRIMLQYKLLVEENHAYKDILIRMKTKDFILKKIVRASNNINSNQIIEKLLQIADTDRRIKNGKISAKYGVEILCSML